MKNEDSAKIIFHRELVIDIEKKKKKRFLNLLLD